MFCSLEFENNVMKNITREVVRECNNKGVSVPDELVTYFIHLMYLDPNRGYTNDAMDRYLTQKLVQECVEKLCQIDDASVNSIRLQVYWATNYTNREQQKKDNRIALNQKALPLLKEILDANISSKEEADKLHKKMVTFTILYSGLGNPTAHPVVKEAHAALFSIFRASEIETFANMSRKDKEQQLIELTQIVTGIRLFNRDCQRGGESIDDLPTILTQATDATRDKISCTLQDVMKRVYLLTHIVEEVYQMDAAKCDEDDKDLEVIIPPGCTKAQLEDVKTALVTLRQHETCLKKLGVELEINGEELCTLLEQLQRILLQLHDTVRFRTAIPTVQVYPLFIELSYIWSELQEETVLMSHINDVLANLTSMNPFLNPLSIEQSFPNEISVTDAERLEISPDVKISFEHGQVNKHVVLLTPANVTNFDDIYIQLEGFCAWALVKCGGALIPGNPNIGLLQYNGLNYAFSSTEAAIKWAKDPNYFVLMSWQIARTKPEFVYLLNLQEQLEAIKSHVLIKTEEKVVVKQDAEVQTVLHPIESYLDKDYTFSEWELKRRAIKLANMVKCKTTSQQTVNHSHFRAHIGIQVKPDKTQETQTKRDNWCNHPRISTYIWGLRGQKEKTPHVVTLTRPVDEQLECTKYGRPCTRRSSSTGTSSSSSVMVPFSPQSGFTTVESEQISEEPVCEELADGAEEQEEDRYYVTD